MAVGKRLDIEKSEDLHEIFQYHAPTEQDVEHYKYLRAAAEHFAHEIVEHCPASADRTHALRMVRDALMWANASIALKGGV